VRYQRLKRRGAIYSPHVQLLGLGGGGGSGGGGGGVDPLVAALHQEGKVVALDLLVLRRWVSRGRRRLVVGGMRGGGRWRVKSRPDGGAPFRR
jgi:hypothetical protein